VLVVLVVQAMTLIQMQRTIAAEADRRVVAALAPGVHLMQRRLRRHRGRVPNRVIQEVAANHGLEAELRRASDPDYDLTASEEARIHRDELSLLQRGTDRYIYSELRPGVYLQLGPMEALMPTHGIVTRLVQTGAVLLVIGGVLFLLLSPFERRLAQLATAASSLGDGNLDMRVNDAGEDAIGEVARAFDGMADRLGGTIEEQRELLRAVSHELRTPVARLLFLVDEARGGDGSARDAALDRCDVSLEEMRLLVDELLTFSRISDRSGLGVLERVAVSALVRECVMQAEELHHTLDIRMNIEDIEAICSPRLVQRAVGNLLSNAVRHATSVIDVELTQDDDLLSVRISDDGSGIDLENRERVLEPFTRLDESRRRDSGGAGLGLAIVAKVAQAHGGSVSIQESHLGGVQVELRLPISGPPPGVNHESVALSRSAHRP
jgi:two-component system sensor histidine kinase RstB